MATQASENTLLPLLSAQDSPLVKVWALEAGSLTLPERFFVTDADPEKKATVPSMSFLISHPSATLVFDLGIMKDLSKYPPAMQTHISNRQPVSTSPDAAESLRAGGVNPEKDIDYVFLSHVHWDHIGTHSDFKNSKFMVGSGTRHILEHGAGSHYPAKIFDKDMLPEDRTWEFPPVPGSERSETAAERQTDHKWKALAVFPNALDFFHDGSVYVIDSPGHLYGHVSLLVHVAEKKWILLGGDCCHDPRILSGEKGIALYDDGEGGKRSVHVDTEKARGTLDNIQSLLEKCSRADSELNVEVILAHDQGWRERNPDRFLPRVSS